MEIWHWVAIAVVVVVVLAIVTKGRIFRVLGEILESIVD